MSELEQAGARAATGTGPLLTAVYTNEPCQPTQGNGPIVPEAVVYLPNGGTSWMLWQASGWSQAAKTPFKMLPLVNGQGEGQLETVGYLSVPTMHLPLLRRRGLLTPLPPGESTVTVFAGSGGTTDFNDSVNMTLVNLAGMSVPPVGRLAVFGAAAANSGEYTARSFTAGGGLCVISIAATAFSRNGGQQIGAMLYLDGDPAGVVHLFANQANVHMPLVGVDLIAQPTAGSHSLNLMALPGTAIDTNDLWSLSVLEMQGPHNVSNLLNDFPCPAQSGGGVIASVPYTATGGVQLICLNVSGYTATPDRMLQAHVLVDGDPVGSMLVYANPANTHMALCGGDIAPGKFPPGQHTVQIVADDGMVTDGNDTCSLTIFEFFS